MGIKDMNLFCSDFLRYLKISITATKKTGGVRAMK